jgi:2-C-methyl-D-erythritol 4-phosphate cytidylyltransferase
MRTREDTPSVGVVIAAAGSSSRYGGTALKQLEVFNGSPLYLHSVKTALRTPGVDHIVLVVPIGHAPAFEEANKANGVLERITIVQGGALRRDSVYLGLLKLRDLEMDYALVHDAARAFVTEEIIIDVMEATIEFGAAIAAIPVVDTLKIVSDGVIDATILRDNLWRAQTPQGANLEVLLEAYHAAITQDFQATDEASVLERAGVGVHVIMGDEANYKVTYPEDLERAR